MCVHRASRVSRAAPFYPTLMPRPDGDKSEAKDDKAQADAKTTKK